MNRKTITTVLFALSLVTIAGAAQAQTFAWEEKISSTPVFEEMYSSAGDVPAYSVTYEESFGN